MVKAYPSIQEKKAPESKAESRFAAGCGFYKLFWLFFLGAFLGDLVETVFCRYSMGRWMSRSSLVWGPFSLVWGFAIVLATVLLYKDRERPDRHIFLSELFSAVPMNTFAVFLRKLSLEKFSGITAKSPLTLEDVLIFYFACSGGSPPLSGSRSSIPGFPGSLKRFQSFREKSLPGSPLFLW